MLGGKFLIKNYGPFFYQIINRKAKIFWLCAKKNFQSKWELEKILNLNSEKFNPNRANVSLFSVLCFQYKFGGLQKYQVLVAAPKFFP